MYVKTLVIQATNFGKGVYTMKTQSLNGKWTLCYADTGKYTVDDYYFDKKLAYYYIKKAQRDFSIFMGETESWGNKIYASNCTLEAKSGSYKVMCVDDGKCYAEGNFNIDKNINKQIGFIKLMYSEKKLFIIEWTLSDGTSGRNHYLAGFPPFDFETYKNKYLPSIMEDVK